MTADAWEIAKLVVPTCAAIGGAFLATLKLGQMLGRQDERSLNRDKRLKSLEEQTQWQNVQLYNMSKKLGSFSTPPPMRPKLDTIP